MKGGMIVALWDVEPEQLCSFIFTLGGIMRLRTGIILAALFTSLSASAANFGEGYSDRLRESRRGGVSSGEWVYLNHPSEYQGPGYVAECRKVSTYSGGPKTGTWRVYYVCRIAN